jgi:hypothetical protein
MAMKNRLHIELMKGIKDLGLAQQYNVLNFMNSLGEMAQLPNKLLGFSPPVKSQAMKEIRMALVLGPEKIDF